MICKTLLVIWAICLQPYPVYSEDFSNALNSIAYRQRQLAAANYGKDGNGNTLNDDELIYLDSEPRGTGQSENVAYGYEKPVTMHGAAYGMDGLQPEYVSDGFMKRYGDRRLPYQEEENELPSRMEHHGKRSFFREREEDFPESLQSVYPQNIEPGFQPSPYVAPSSFRERADGNMRELAKLRSGRKLYQEDQADGYEDYSDATNSILQRYKDHIPSDILPDGISSEEAQGIIKKLLRNGPSPYEKDELATSGHEGVYIPPENRFYPYRTDDDGSFVIAKRSLEDVKHHKADDKSHSRQDPKVMAELQSLFGHKERKNSTESSTTPETTTVENGEKEKSSKVKTEKDARKTDEPGRTVNITKRALDVGQKEVAAFEMNNAPLKIQKKGVDWSNYFGIDKRTPRSVSPVDSGSESPPKPVALPLVHKVVHPSERKITKRSGRSQNKYDELVSLLKGNDEELKEYAESLTDNVLKYVGAHQGVNRKEELDKVMQYVMAELMEAYNLEVLRQRMHEYKDDQAQSEIQKHPYYHDVKEKKGSLKKEKAELLPPWLVPLEKVNGTADYFLHPQSEVEEYGYPSGAGMKWEVPNEAYKICPVFNHALKWCSDTFYDFDIEERSLIPVCAFHQICTSCSDGDPQGMKDCDMHYLYVIVTECGKNIECQKMLYRNMKSLKAHTPFGRYPFDNETCDKCVNQPFYDNFILNPIF